MISDEQKAKLGKKYHPGMDDHPVATRKVQHPDDPDQFMIVNTTDKVDYKGDPYKPFVEKVKKADDEKTGDDTTKKKGKKSEE